MNIVLFNCKQDLCGVLGAKNFRKWFARPGGFTLMEILLVVGVVGILLALILPVVKGVRERSQGVNCVHNMRQLGTALHLYRAEHNGWFPPGYPVAPNKIEAKDALPGNPSQPGMSTINFNNTLVPAYIKELPLCPGLRLNSEGIAKLPAGMDEKKRLRSLGGGYGLNAILLQIRPESMPGPYWVDPPLASYAESRLLFLLETGAGNASWSFAHQRQALVGVPAYNTKGRNHGNGDVLNFMFLDGHIEVISRNDARNVPEEQKSWLQPTNPDARFKAWGADGLYIPHTQLTKDQFRQMYPDFYPPKP